MKNRITEVQPSSVSKGIAKPLVIRRFLVRSKFCGTIVDSKLRTEEQSKRLVEKLHKEALENNLPEVQFGLVENGV